MSSPRLLSSVLLGAALLATPAFAQQTPQRTPCIAEQLPESRISNNKLPSGEYNTFAGGGLVVRCPSKKIVLKADSAEIYGDEKRVYLVGHVNYDEPRLSLTSDFLTYFTAQERIVATGNVNGRLPSGSTLRGPMVDYKRAVPRIRTRPQTLATGRPTVTIVQRNQSGKEEPPIDVVANTIFMDGDSLIYGSGQVDIKRPEVTATGDSTFINSGTEVMQLLRNPVVQGTRGRPFKLVGERIDMFSRDRKLNRVLSRTKAVATSQDLILRSDTIDLRITNDLLERAFAWGKSRARATSSSQNMLADSLDVRMPAQRVREVHALRKAFAEGHPDTTRYRADTTDWLRGDTIVATFDTLPPVDTTKGPDIRRLVSSDSASAYYHVAPSDTTQKRLAINYVRGRQITIDFSRQKVATVAVQDRVAGIFLEPTSDTVKARPGRPGTQPPGARAVPTPPVRRP